METISIIKTWKEYIYIYTYKRINFEECLQKCF